MLLELELSNINRDLALCINTHTHTNTVPNRYAYDDAKFICMHFMSKMFCIACLKYDLNPINNIANVVLADQAIKQV